MMEQDLLLREPETGVSPFGFVNRIFDDLLTRTGQSGRTLRPALDVSETEHAVMVTVELPGLAKEDVKITIEDGVLSISDKKERTWHRIERVYGAFQRSLTLPRGVDANAADAAFQNGVLVVTLPKTEDVKPKTLKIR
jgi:HSP20 family protein